MATLYLNSSGTAVISNSNCSYGSNTITTNTLSGGSNATLQWLFYLKDICGTENAIINSITVSYNASSNRYSSLYKEGTARTGYLIQSGSGVTTSSSYTNKTISRDTSSGNVNTPVSATFNNSYSGWSGSHLFTHNGKKAAGVFISLINNASVNFVFDVSNLVITVDYTVPTYTITANASPSNGGTVSGGGSYTSGKTATLTATPKAGYKFVKWSDNDTTNPRTVTVTGNVTYTAYFELDRINLILVDMSQSLGVLVDTDTKDDDEVYVDTTKVYG